jgi:hypothetical protein
MAYLMNTHSSDFVVPNSDGLLSSVDVGFNTLLWKPTIPMSPRSPHESSNTHSSDFVVPVVPKA